MADFENQDRDFLVLLAANVAIRGRRDIAMVRVSRLAKPCPIAGDHRSPPGAHAGSSWIAFWAGPARLVICFSAVRVISIRQRFGG